MLRVRRVLVSTKKVGHFNMTTSESEVSCDASGVDNRPWQVAVLLLRDFSAYRQNFQTVTGGART